MLDFFSSFFLFWALLLLDLGQEQEQRRARDLLGSKGVFFVEVDGALDENRERRNELFGISGQRGKYPQVFIDREGAVEFVGSWDTLETLNDMSQIPQEVLDANPDIRTFEHVFADVIQG